ncbi:MAG: hypothetical protein OP8BY_1760 [Candidatus Saccharicenans subterraneus]|uniref:Uncharacterized protein n=1 Tax=Candidatus Saccharicenans subterraneus TaxID=2508984 RepID=A0A3E2BNE3_9BACT|nr:MAG: hypothetical protein OP8BY_1760 [Candidatus Saccharicenans subterraneum]
MRISTFPGAGSCCVLEADRLLEKTGLKVKVMQKMKIINFA